LIPRHDRNHAEATKTTISIPDEDFEAAEQIAEEPGVSRSELYANAVRELVARRRRQDVTDRLDRLYGDGFVSSELDPALAELQGTVATRRSVVMRRGEIRWADLPEPVGPEPGFRRPVLVIQEDSFDRSRIATVLVVAITSNGFLASAPGNVRLSRNSGRLKEESVVTVSQVAMLDKSLLMETAGRLSQPKLRSVEEGLRLVMGL